ncbi:MAG TPA: hypothetical protein VF618_00910 [Thermoanaerobaculia bacterium]
MHTDAPSSYRLERWLALLLGLLFFLPIVANADDLLATGSYHGEEVPHVSGESFLAMVEHEDGPITLQPVRIRVTREHDPISDHGKQEQTGKRVDVKGFEGMLLRGTALQPGRVTSAKPDCADIDIYTNQTFVLGDTRYTLRFRCGAIRGPGRRADCRLMLEASGVTQELAVREAYENGSPKLTLPETEPHVYFAGDLDGDGKLDLIIDLRTTVNEWRPTLFLSTAAKPGKLVGQTAVFSSVGC